MTWKYHLVGGLEHGFCDFPYSGNFIIPTDFHIFQRGRHTTNQLYSQKYPPISDVNYFVFFLCVCFCFPWSMVNLCWSWLRGLKRKLHLFHLRSRKTWSFLAVGRGPPGAGLSISVLWCASPKSSSRHGWPWLSIETYGDFGIRHDLRNPRYLLRRYLTPLYFIPQSYTPSEGTAGSISLLGSWHL